MAIQPDPLAKYDPVMVQPMRDETTAMGMRELHSTEDVDSFLGDKTGTKLLLYNSVCGCAAGAARPGLKLALQHGTTPDQSASVFAGMEVTATAHARSYFPEVPGTSPAIALLKDGELVFWMPRHAIEGRSPEMIAEELTGAFDKFCAKASA